MRNNFDRTNFFERTICVFEQVEKPKVAPDYVSYKKEYFEDDSFELIDEVSSRYWYTEDGVFRESKHWGCVASCNWAFVPKNPHSRCVDWDTRFEEDTYEFVDGDDLPVVGFCKWDSFHCSSIVSEQYDSFERGDTGLYVRTMPDFYEEATLKAFNHKHIESIESFNRRLESMKEWVGYQILKKRTDENFARWLATNKQSEHQYKSVYLDYASEEEVKAGKVILLPAEEAYLDTIKKEKLAREKALSRFCEEEAFVEAEEPI